MVIETIWPAKSHIFIPWLYAEKFTSTYAIVKAYYLLCVGKYPNGSFVFCRTITEPGKPVLGLTGHWYFMFALGWIVSPKSSCSSRPQEYECYGLNVDVPLKLVCWYPNIDVLVLRGGPSGRWLWGRMIGYMLLQKETPECLLTPSAIWGHSEKTAVHGPGSGLLPDTELTDALVLDFPTLRTVRSKCLLMKTPCLLYFCYRAQMD